jgi:hypothetical protein
MKALAEITQKYVSQSFRRYPCMGLIQAVYSDAGVKLPTEFEGMTLTSYLGQWIKDPWGVQFSLLRLGATLGQPSSIRAPKLLDFLIMFHDWHKSRNAIAPGYAPAVYVGKGQVLESFLREGVLTVKIDKYNRPIMARRLI